MGDDGFYEVEKIISHRRKASGSGFEYYLKWKGYPDSENSWEPEENVTDDLIIPYRLAVQAKSKRKSTAKETPKETKSKQPQTGSPSRTPGRSSTTQEGEGRTSTRGRRVRRVSPETTNIGQVKDTAGAADEELTRNEKQIKRLFTGLQLERIDGICDLKGKYHFKLVWKDDEKVDLVPMTVCNKLWPQAVIAYYENHLTFIAKKDS